MTESKNVAQVVIGLGANQGDPGGQIREALSRLEKFAVGPVRVSSFWRSEAVGMSDHSSGFINAVAAFETTAEPVILLRELQAIEVALGRPADHGKNVARNIDLDILAFGTERIDLPELTVPHPRMLERLFVLLPLEELLPDYQDPKTGLSLDHWISQAPSIDMQKLN